MECEKLVQGSFTNECQENYQNIRFSGSAGGQMGWWWHRRAREYTLQKRE
jgi:hypothetical protein